jgi:hypothetical protein
MPVHHRSDATNNEDQEIGQTVDAVPSEDRAGKGSSYQPDIAVEQLLNWIKATKERLMNSDRTESCLRENNKKLADTVSDLEAQQQGLEAQLEGLRKDTEKQMAALEEESKREVEDLGNRLTVERTEAIERIINESEERETRAVSQLRYRIKRDLEPMIKDFFTFSSSPGPDQALYMEKMFRTILRTLKTIHRIELDYE